MSKLWRYPIGESVFLIRGSSGIMGTGKEITPFYYDNFGLYPNGPYTYSIHGGNLSFKNTYNNSFPQSWDDLNFFDSVRTIRSYFFYDFKEELGNNTRNYKWPLFDSVDLYYQSPFSNTPAGSSFYQMEHRKILAAMASNYGTAATNAASILVIDSTEPQFLEAKYKNYIPFEWNKTAGGQKLATLLWNGKYWAGTSNAWPGEDNTSLYYVRMFWLKIGSTSVSYLPYGTYPSGLNGYTDSEGYTKGLNSAYDIKRVNNTNYYRRKKYRNLPDMTTPFEGFETIGPTGLSDYSVMGAIIQISPTDDFNQYYTAMRIFNQYPKGFNGIEDPSYSYTVFQKRTETTLELNGEKYDGPHPYFDKQRRFDYAPGNFGFSLNLSSNTNPSKPEEPLIQDQSIWRNTRELRIIKIEYTPPPPHLIKFKLSVGNTDYETPDMNILENGNGMNSGIQYLLSIPSIITSSSVSNLPQFPLKSIQPLSDTERPSDQVPRFWTVPREVATYTQCPDVMNYAGKPVDEDRFLFSEQTDYYSIWETTVYLPHTDYSYQGVQINEVYDFNIEGTDIISKEETLYELSSPSQGHGKRIKIRFRAQRKEKFFKLKCKNIHNTSGEQFIKIGINSLPPNNDNIGGNDPYYNTNKCINCFIRPLELLQPYQTVTYTLLKDTPNYFYLVSNWETYEIESIDSSTSVHYTLSIESMQDRTREHIGFLKNSGLADNLPRVLWDSKTKLKIEISQPNTDEFNIYTGNYGHSSGSHSSPYGVYTLEPQIYSNNIRYYGPFKFPNIGGTVYANSVFEVGSIVQIWSSESIYSHFKCCLRVFEGYCVLDYIGVVRMNLSPTGFIDKNYTLAPLIDATSLYADGKPVWKTSILYTNRDPNEVDLWTVNAVVSQTNGRTIKELHKLPDKNGFDGFGSQNLYRVATLGSEQTSSGIRHFWRKIDDNEFAYLAPETVKLSFEGWDDV